MTGSWHRDNRNIWTVSISASCMQQNWQTHQSTQTELSSKTGRCNQGEAPNKTFQQDKQRFLRETNKTFQPETESEGRATFTIFPGGDNIGVPLKSLYIPGRNPRTRVSRNSPEMLTVFLSRTGSSNNLQTEGSLRALENLKICTSGSAPSVLEFWSEGPAFQIEWVFWISLGCEKTLISPIKNKTITTV